MFAALHQIPAVDQYREASIISVSPNGGNFEEFHVKVPMDRIMVGARGQSNPLPPGLEWPDHPELAGIRGEIFKLRNSRDAVVGVASRFAIRDSEVGDAIEWVLHLPARGSMFVRLDPEPVDGTRRSGPITAGTREFSILVGAMSERWVAEGSNSEVPTGRIELIAAFVANEDLSDEEHLVPVGETFE
jgi:hypothetical protein